MSILLTLTAAYGICFGLMNEKVSILNKLLYALPLFRREEENFFQRMFKCSYCTGFHTGWMVWVVESAPRLLGSGVDGLEFTVGALVTAFASSVFCYAVDTLIAWFER